MSFFRFHNRNLLNLFVINSINNVAKLQNINTKISDDLSHKDYPKGFYVLSIDEFLYHVDDCLEKIFNFNNSFLSNDIELLNKNNLKFQLLYNYNGLISLSTDFYSQNFEIPIMNSKSNYFRTQKKSEILVNIKCLYH